MQKIKVRSSEVKHDACPHFGIAMLQCHQVMQIQAASQARRQAAAYRLNVGHHMRRPPWPRNTHVFLDVKFVHGINFGSFFTAMQTRDLCSFYGFGYKVRKSHGRGNLCPE